MPNKFNNAKELIHYLMSDEILHDHYFRGIKCKKERYPKIVREELIDFEQEILKKFMRKGLSYTNNSSNAFDLLSQAQHYGLPTRLVDWTENPLVALFFAINSSNKNHKPKILFLKKEKTIPIHEPMHSTSHGQLGLKTNNPIQEYIHFLNQLNNVDFLNNLLTINEINYEIDPSSIKTKIESKIKENKMVVILPNSSSQRLIRQSGIFFLPRKLDKSEIDLNYKASEVFEIEIDIHLRIEILDILKKLGINKQTLFNDLNSVCEMILDEIREIKLNFPRELL